MIRTLKQIVRDTRQAGLYRAGGMLLDRVSHRIDMVISSAVQRPALEELRDLHRGERCFILGNGPSLRDVDLRLLAGEITFVTNYFYLHPQLEVLQPDYYCVSDLWFFNSGGNPGWQQGLSRFPLSTIMFLPIELRREMRSLTALDQRHIRYLRCNRTREIWHEGAVNLDVTRVLSTGDTVILDFCLPLAYFLGFSEVFLLGCDTDYGEGAGSVHFYEERTPTRSRLYHREVWYPNVTRSYEIVRRAFEASGRQIFNATDGGRLEVFPRVRLENILAGRNRSNGREAEAAGIAVEE